MPNTNHTSNHANPCHEALVQLNTERLGDSQEKRSRKVVIKTSNADIFTTGRGFMGDFDLTMQLQVGCPGGCAHCYVEEGFRLAPRDVQLNWGYEIRRKNDAHNKFRKHLANNNLADKTIYASGVTDNYAAAPALMHDIWNQLIQSPHEQRPRRIVTQTRFRADRDAQLMAEYNRSTTPADGGPATLVSLSIGTDREDLIRAWEKATPSFASRLQIIERLRNIDVPVVATLSPLGPWHDLRGALHRLQDLGILYLTVLFFKESGPTRTPKAFLELLRRQFPFVLEPSWQAERVAEMQQVFGPERVLTGKPGFSSLAAPHLVGHHLPKM